MDTALFSANSLHLIYINSLAHFYGPYVLTFLFQLAAVLALVIGKDISMLEVVQFILEIFRKLEFRLEDPSKEWEIDCGWFAKQPFRYQRKVSDTEYISSGMFFCTTEKIKINLGDEGVRCGVMNESKPTLASSLHVIRHPGLVSSRLHQLHFKYLINVRENKHLAISIHPLAANVFE
jgi:hypothetical protein